MWLGLYNNLLACGVTWAVILRGTQTGSLMAFSLPQLSNPERLLHAGKAPPKLDTQPSHWDLDTDCRASSRIGFVNLGMVSFFSPSLLISR